MKRRSRIFRTTFGLSLALAAFALVACEGIVVGTATPGETEPTETPAGVEPTAEPSAEPTASVEAATPTPRTPPTGGGRADATRTPRATATAVRSVSTGGGSSSSGSVAPVVISDVSQLDGATLVGAGNVELGVLLPTDQALNSICDNLFDGGAAFGANSIHNDLSTYGGPFGVNSPFNPFATAPPQILLEGQVIGRLTVSGTLNDSVDPHAVLDWLGCPVSPL